jgi:hypothetical protein
MIETAKRGLNDYSSGIQSICHTDYESTRPKLTLVGFRIDEGDVHGNR